MLREARELAGLSQELAAYMLHMDRRTLARIEQNPNPLEQTLVLMMAEVYRQPNLIMRYCAQRCPIGRQCGWEVPADGLAGTVIRYLKEQGDAAAVQAHLLQDSCDGELEPELIKELADVAKAIFAIQIAAAQKRTTGVASTSGSARKILG